MAAPWLRLARSLRGASCCAAAATAAAGPAWQPHPAPPQAGVTARCSEAQQGESLTGWYLKRKLMNTADKKLQEMGFALRPGVVTKRFSPGKTEVIRIVLTGGPCAGKSSALEHLTRAATAAGYDVYAAPEVATLLFNSGVQLPSKSDKDFERKLDVFQHSVLAMQLQMERSITDIASSTGRPSIIVFDRGLVDGKAYVSAEQWRKLTEETEASAPGLDKPRKHITEEYMLARYNLIVHLVTAADGAPKFYKFGKVKDDSGRDVIRGEPPELAIELDKKLQKAWSSHTRSVVIPNGPDGFPGKLSRCTEAILGVAMEIHPQWRFFQSKIDALEKENQELKTKLELQRGVPDSNE